jgi:hypothetical protein
MLAPPCDLSDGITMPQLTKIISVLFRISYFYLDRTVEVKSKPDQSELLWQVLHFVNRTLSEN